MEQIVPLLLTVRVYVCVATISCGEGDWQLMVFQGWDGGSCLLSSSRLGIEKLGLGFL